MGGGGEAGRGRRHEIVLFPFMAQGHIIPFLALANLIEERTRGSNCTITLVNTPLNIRNLRSTLPPDSAVLLRELPFSSADHGLPPDSENTDSLRHHHILRLFQASESLRPHFERLLSDFAGETICIIADVFFGWTVTVAEKLGIFHAAFSTCGGYGTAAYISLWLHLPHSQTESDDFAVPGFPESLRLRRNQLSHYMRAADGNDPWARFLRRQISLSLGSNAMLCNTVEAVEIAGLKLLRRNTGLRIWPVGPLLPLAGEKSVHRRAGKKSGITVEIVAEWLDSHPPASVLFVSFGSQNTISSSQTTALAEGLESSGIPFVWVIRPPIGFDLEENFSTEKFLPEGFEARVGKRNQGLLVRNWAPQLEILSHRSTGAFLSHCGWNSVLESLSRGVPIIGWPLASEQFYNAKMLVEEMGVCVELARGIEDGVKSEEVERVIGVVMGGGEVAAEMRRKAAEAAEKIRAAMREMDGEKGSSLEAVDDFVRTIVSSKKQGKTDEVCF